MFDVAFRSHDQEPIASIDLTATEPAEQLRSAPTGVGGNWRNEAQAQALSERDVSEFHAEIDFGLLAREATERDVPEAGYLNLLYGSRFDIGSGIDPDGGPIGEDEIGPIAQPYHDAFTHASREQGVDGVQWRNPQRRKERPDDALTPCNVTAQRFGASARNVLLLDLDGVSSVTIHLAEAGLDPIRPIRLRAESTTEAEVTLRSTVGTTTVGLDAGCTKQTVQITENQRGGAVHVSGTGRSD